MQPCIVTSAKPKTAPTAALTFTNTYQYTEKAWSLDDWDETLAVDKTRFTKHQIRVLAIALKIDAVKWSHGIQPEPTMALVVTLMRLS
jgi:hypothetical protein